MKRIVAILALVTILSACESEQAASPTPEVGTPSETPVTTAPPAPALTGEDQKFIRAMERENLVNAYYGSEQEAIDDANGLCDALRESGEMVNVELAPNFLDLEVDGYTIPVGVYPLAIKYYCNEFSHLVQEYPAP